jgi:hypothetical protein
LLAAALVVIAASVSGCTFEVLGLGPIDLGASGDVDSAAPRGPDLALADVDLGEADLAMPTGADLATTAPDLATPRDMTPVAVLSCTVAATTSDVDLTAAGTTDWVLWGRTFSETRTEEIGAAAIGSLSASPAQRFSDGEIGFSWSNGEPTQSGDDVETGLYYLTGTFSLPVTASETTLQRLRIYVGGWRSRGRFTATLPGAQSCVDTSQKDEDGGWAVTYTILFRPAQPNQTLTVTWQREESFDTFGNVRFSAAALDPAP